MKFIPFMILGLVFASSLSGADFKETADRIQEQMMNRFADRFGIITDYCGLNGEAENLIHFFDGEI
ncbi:MAG: hypothetical protein SPK75_09685 [Victivallales bacterium]|nr:hypothetical protein [Victivallales bacterium]